ncbi:hypothetical protein CKO44_17535 [Rubrivivax gelatinosus]|nr:hypothetical protein [Rubrivivax gelatinosus]
MSPQDLSGAHSRPAGTAARPKGVPVPPRETSALLRLAWRNLLRNRRRSALTLAIVAVAAASSTLLGGYLTATVRTLETDTVRQVGHLQIVRRGALDFGRGQAARYALHGGDAVLAALRADPVLAPRLAVATSMLQAGGIAGRFEAGASTTFVGQGWEPQARARMLGWDGHALGIAALASPLDSGRPLAGVIGAGLAQQLGLCAELRVDGCKPMPEAAPAAPPASAAAWSADLDRLGEQAAAARAPARGGAEIELLASGAGGAPNVVRLQLLAAQRLGQREADASHVAMPLPLAQRLVFGPDSQAVSALVLQLRHSADLPLVQAHLARWLALNRPELELLDFETVQPAFRQVVTMFGTLFRFVVVLMVVLTLFSVGNTLNMAVSERTREIGTLRAIGWLRRRVQRLFLVEGALIGLLGAALGVVGAALLAAGLINTGRFQWTPPSRGTPVPIAVDLGGDPALVPGVLLLFTLVACLCSWWPARRAAAQPIVEALRHV